MINRELEIYLSKLDKSLGAISVSEKAEIITEIKSHVLDALENSNKTTTEVLQSLGEPEQVANKYLLERGLETQKPPKHPLIKWIIIGFLGTFLISVVSVFVLLWKFSPIISVDEERGRVQILGGLIDINEGEGTVKIDGNLKLDNHFNEKFVGEKTLKNEIKKINFDFTDIKSEMKNSNSHVFEYKCDLNGKPEINETMDSLIVNFKESTGAKCEFYLPKNLDLIINSINGKFDFEEIENNLNFHGVNGSVKFNPKKTSKYKYKLNVQNGKVSEFESSMDSTAYNIDISIMNGKIKN